MSWKWTQQRGIKMYHWMSNPWRYIAPTFTIPTSMVALVSLQPIYEYARYFDIVTPIPWGEVRGAWVVGVLLFGALNAMIALMEYVEAKGNK